jgi:ribosome-binding protein aMBF1 (putative translation factor)
MCSTQDGSGEGCTGWCALCGRACCAAHRTVQTSENQARLIVCDDCRTRFWMRRAWRWWWGARP